MYIKKTATKILPVKVIKLAKKSMAKKPAKQEAELEMFSKAWEWDQFCNHCID